MLEPAVAVEKGLPQNAEAERAVLGSILLDPAAISLVVPILEQEDFPECHDDFAVILLPGHRCP